MSFDLTNKNISDTFQNLLQKTGSEGHLYDLIGNQVDNLTIGGTLTAHSYVTSESIVNTSSGSTAFGNSQDDTHTFIGAITASGPISSSSGVSRFDKIVTNRLRIIRPATSIIHSTIIDHGTRASAGDIVFSIPGDISASGDMFLSESLRFDATKINLYANGRELYIRSGSTSGIKMISNGSNSYLGIGTTAPTKNLTVQGDISASGDMYLGNQTTFISMNNGTIQAGSGSIIVGSNLSSILGGTQNKISGSEESSIVSGKTNLISGSQRSVIVGGTSNIIRDLGTNIRNVIVGGNQNAITGSAGQRHVIVGGGSNKIYTNNINLTSNFIGGGSLNSLRGTGFSSIMGGNQNKIVSSDTSVGVDYHTIGGGQLNLIQFTGGTSGVGPSGIFCGANNQITGSSSADFLFSAVIVGGTSNKIYVEESFNTAPFIGGGKSNKISDSQMSNILGGENNTLTNADSASILGGYSNTIASHNNTFVLGSNLTTSQVDTTYTENIIVKGDISASGYISTESHITASGNISSSGIISADTIKVENKFAVAYDGTEGVRFAYANNQPIQIGKSSTNPTTIEGHITASGNISSSGTIVGNELQDTSLTDGRVVVVGSSGVLADSEKLRFDGNSVQLEGNITSSGNISSSGDNHYIGDRVKIGENVAGTKDGIAVAGDISASGNLFAGGVTNNESIFGAIGAGGGTGSPSGSKITIGAGTMASASLHLKSANHNWELAVSKQAVGFSPGGLLFRRGGSDTHVFDTAGNFGIGNVVPTKTLTVEGDISASGGFFVSSSGNTMINSDNTGSMATHLGALSVNYGNEAQLTGSLTSVGNGYGDIVKIGSGTTIASRTYTLGSDRAWTISQANGSISSSLTAIALGTNPTIDGMLLRGFVTANAHDTLVVGQKVYNEANGRVANGAGADSGDVVRVLGYCVGLGSHIYFNPSNDWIEIA